MTQRFATSEYEAAFHLLDSPVFGGRAVARIAWTDEMELSWFDWQELFDDPTWSSGELALIDCAYSLFSGRPGWEADNPVTLPRLMRELDDANFARVLEAVAIRRGGLRGVA